MHMYIWMQASLFLFILERCQCMLHLCAGYKTILDWLGLGYLIIGRDENDHED